jgi:plastocyanin
MSNETLFYICGVFLALSAVGFSLAGLKLKGFPGRAMPVIVLWFALFVGGVTTFAVLNGKDEAQHREAEFQRASKEVEESEGGQPTEVESSAGEEPAASPDSEQEPEGGESESEGGGESAAAGAASTLKLAAEPSAIAFDTTSLTAKAGKVTIDFNNPAPIEHDVAIEKEGKEIAVSKLVTEAETSVTAELEPGTYTFLCTVPGHAEAGMEGTLTVK